MNKIRLPQLLYFVLVFMLAACQSVVQGREMFQPGDMVNGMSLTTGAKDASPLWVFCSPAQYAGNTTTSECNVPMIPRLAIGYMLMPENSALSKMDWSQIDWKLTIDGQPIDLNSFGTYNFVQPALSHNASPIREIFVSFTAWDVVLTNLSPGEYTILGSALVGAESHNWVIHLTIEGTYVGSRRSWAGPENQQTSWQYLHIQTSTK